MGPSTLVFKPKHQLLPPGKFLGLKKVPIFFYLKPYTSKYIYLMIFCRLSDTLVWYSNDWVVRWLGWLGCWMVGYMKFCLYMGGGEINYCLGLLWIISTCLLGDDVSRILDTIPSTTSKKFRTHIWEYASLPPSWLYTACTVVPIVLGFQPTASRAGRIN